MKQGPMRRTEGILVLVNMMTTRPVKQIQTFYRDEGIEIES